MACVVALCAFQRGWCVSKSRGQQVRVNQEHAAFLMAELEVPEHVAHTALLKFGNDLEKAARSLLK